MTDVKKSKSLSEEIKDGNGAKMVLSSEVYRNAWEQMDAYLIDCFRKCNDSNADELRKIRISIGLLNSLQANFERVLTTGKLAQGELAEQEMDE